MQINWASRTGDIPIATITHKWKNVLVDIDIIASRIRRVINRELDDVALLNEYIRQVFMSKTTTFQGQRINADSASIIAEVIDVGATYDTVMWLDNLFALAGAPRFSETRIMQLFEQTIADAASSQGKPGSQFIQEASRRGCDVIRKTLGGNCFAIRDRFGDTIVFLNNFTFTDRTGHIATQIATNKMWTMDALGLAGLPVPASLLANTVGDAVKFFSRSAPKPSVVKPVSTDYGIAVFTNLRSVNDVAQAYQIAAKHGPVLIQEHVPGDDYRLLVVDGVVAGVTRRKPFHVTGNGSDTIEQLAKHKLAQRARDRFYQRFNKIDVKSPEIAATLGRQGLALTDILPVGGVARLRDNPNVSSGGEHEFVDTASCHPDNLDLAVQAANVVGLDLAGVDFLSLDIAKSWRETGAKICEINPTPAMSVSTGVDLLLNRLRTADQGLSMAEEGDTLIITNGMVGSAAERLDTSIMKYDQEAGLYDQDLDELDERQYFYQSYLAKKHGNIRAKISLDRLLLYGCPNRHVTKAILDTSVVTDDRVVADIRRRLPPGCLVQAGIESKS